MLETTAPAAVSVVTRREIEARGADNVLDALRGETGVSLQGRAIGGRKVLSLRGMDSKHTLYLVDGRRVGATDGVIGHSDFQYDWIAVEDIERIEVVRGPLSVLYGSEAMGGVVNVITREPGDQWQLRRHRRGQPMPKAAAAAMAGGCRCAPTARSVAASCCAPAQRPPASTRSPRPQDPRISELEGRDKDDGWLGLGWRGAAAASGQRVDFEHRAGREER